MFEAGIEATAWARTSTLRLRLRVIDLLKLRVLFLGDTHGYERGFSTHHFHLRTCLCRIELISIVRDIAS